ncbi:hypothetical protein [Maribacter sp. 2210JD10-5]|uniref:hypothetical protein n=1 Tax=Maribacter sp. 2210JD10-5 TaxID=3386272 RepID=UPI0039BCB112
MRRSLIYFSLLLLTIFLYSNLEQKDVKISMKDQGNLITLESNDIRDSSQKPVSDDFSKTITDTYISDDNMEHYASE